MTPSMRRVRSTPVRPGARLPACSLPSARAGGWLGLLACAAAVSTCLLSAPVGAQVEVMMAPPPPEFVATATPTYYEGHAAYWYGGRWYYRVGNGWGFYREEPVYLSQYRVMHGPPRRFYEGRGAYRPYDYRR